MRTEEGKAGASQPWPSYVRRLIGLPCLPLGKPFHRLRGELEAGSGFITNDPGIVPRGDAIGVARTYLHLRAIVGDDLQPTRKQHAVVLELAAIGAHDGLYVLRPLPSGFKHLSCDFEVTDSSGFYHAMVERSGLIRRGFQVLILQAFGHKVFSFPTRPVPAGHPLPL